VHRLLLLTVVLALLLSACGDDESSAVTVTEGASSTEETTSTDDTTTVEVTSTTAEDDSRASVVVRDPSAFTSPTGNIGCLIDKEMVRCDIAEREWAPPPAPDSCTLDYGQGITLRAGAPPEFVCAGDTALNSDAALPYGESIQGGLIRCDSEESGITCTDMETGRGFTLSKAAYELF